MSVYVFLQQSYDIVMVCTGFTVHAQNLMKCTKSRDALFRRMQQNLWSRRMYVMAIRCADSKTNRRQFSSRPSAYFKTNRRQINAHAGFPNHSRSCAQLNLKVDRLRIT